MTDNEQICARCGSEIYNYQGVAYYGMYIAHRDPADCTEYLKRKIQAIEKEAIALRAAVDKPQWIDAAERRPPDAWPRPYVCRDGAGHGTYWATRRYQGDSWWAPGQLGEEVDRHVLYWMEVYPLPDGFGPKISD